MSRSIRLILLAIVLALPAVGALRVHAQDATPTPEVPPVLREVLVSADPLESPGEQLSLVRYTVQPGVRLPSHVHPGIQIASIQSGVLHYVVLEGQPIQVLRAARDGHPATTELLEPGHDTDLHPGDAVIETQDSVHYGENLGTEPVVILAATLLTEVLPAAIEVDVEPTATP